MHFCSDSVNKGSMQQISPTQLKTISDENNTPFTILDVREAQELAIANLGNVRHIPLGELTTRWHELNPKDWIITLCHHGMRSEMAAGYLRSQGFEKVTNLSGGIDRWSIEVDPTIPRY